MLKKVYLAMGTVLITGYLGWSLLGLEWEGPARDPVPSARRAAVGSAYVYHRRGFHFGTGFGFGK